MTTDPAPPSAAAPAPLTGRRLFIGIRASVASSNALAAAVETLARRAKESRLDLRWVPPTNYHVTLKYLGWTREETVGAVCDSIDRALRGTERFAFRAARIGAFPTLEKATVLWAGIEDERPLIALAARLETAMVDLGFPAATRAFRPHITLARGSETRVVRDLVLPLSEQMFSETRVDGVMLLETEAKPSSSMYGDIRKITFKPTDPPLQRGPERQTPALDLGAPHTHDPSETDDGWPRGQGPTESTD